MTGNDLILGITGRLNMLIKPKKAFLSVIALAMVLASLTLPSKLQAQEEPSEEEMVLPQGSNSAPTPPVLIDESDSNSPQTVEDYEAQ